MDDRERELLKAAQRVVEIVRGCLTADDDPALHFALYEYDEAALRASAQSVFSRLVTEKDLFDAPEAHTEKPEKIPRHPAPEAEVEVLRGALRAWRQALQTRKSQVDEHRRNLPPEADSAPCPPELALAHLRHFVCKNVVERLEELERYALGAYAPALEKDDLCAVNLTASLAKAIRQG